MTNGSIITWQEARVRGLSSQGLLRQMGVGAPPIPIFDIVRSLDVELSQIDGNPGWSGAVKISGSRAKIWLRSQDSFVRKRFTAAHELGHLLLHPLNLLEAGKFRDNESFSGDWMEVQANKFAASLLVPSQMLINLLKLDTKSTANAHDVFKVSYETMCIRISDILRASNV